MDLTDSSCASSHSLSFSSSTSHSPSPPPYSPPPPSPTPSQDEALRDQPKHHTLSQDEPPTPSQDHPTRSQDHPKHHTRSQDQPKHHTRSQDQPKHHTRSQDEPKHHTRSQDEPKHHTRSQDHPKHHTRSQNQPPTPWQNHPTPSQNHPTPSLPARRARLTRRNLAIFDEMDPAQQGSQKVAPVKTLSTGDSGFAEQARLNGIRNPRTSSPPANLADLCKRLTDPRPSPPPSATAFQRYSQRLARQPNEATLLVEVTHRLLKEYDDDEDGYGYDKVFNKSFVGFPRQVGFNNGLSVPKPDLVQGLERRAYESFPIDTIPGAVLHTGDHSLALPRLIGEWKTSNNNLDQATLQSAYASAALVHAHAQALDAIRKPHPDRQTSVLSFTTNGSDIKFYAHHVDATQGPKPQYHQWPLRSISLTRTLPGFLEGYRYLRNAQDWAREQSYTLRNDLNDTLQPRASPSKPIHETHEAPSKATNKKRKAQAPTRASKRRKC